MRTHPGPVAYAAAVIAVAALWFVNDNLYALAVFPLIAFAHWWNPDLPRLRWLFYAFYPAHLAVLAAFRLLAD